MNDQSMATNQQDPTWLYTRKAQTYAKYRPDYAPEALIVFRDSVTLPPESTAIDVGSGTGMLTRHLLGYCEKVFALEPNPAMREIAEREMGDQPGFRSLRGRAEDIPLPDHSIDLIVVGQAIHWFYPEETLAEFQRIAKPMAWLLLAHIRSMDESLNQAMNDIFTESNGCLPSNQRPSSNQVTNSYYFNGGKFETLRFLHNSKEDWTRFLGGIASATYAPDEDHPLYNKFAQAVRQIFDKYKKDNTLTWKIATEISFGLLLQQRDP